MLGQREALDVLDEGHQRHSDGHRLHPRSVVRHFLADRSGSIPVGITRGRAVLAARGDALITVVLF